MDTKKAVYVGRSAELIVRATTVALLFSGAERQLNMMLYGPPGCGKTEIPLLIMERVFGKDHVSMVKHTAHTSPTKVIGKNVLDPQAMSITLNTSGTPSDPSIKGVLADELPRANDAVLGEWIHILDSKNGNQPVVIATCNFPITDPKLYALTDRFGLHVHIKPDSAYRQVAEMQVQGCLLDIGQPIPDLPRIERVNMLAQSLTDQAKSMVVNAAVTLAEEAQATGVAINNRHIAMWVKLIARCNAYEFDTNDFDKVGKMAKEALGWANVLLTPEDFNAWQEVVGTAADPVTATIDAVLQSAYTEFKRVSQITDVKDRSSEAGKLGEVIANGEANLRQLLGDDKERIEQTIAQLNTWFMSAVKGKLLTE